MAAPKVTAEQVLAHRARAQGLDRRTTAIPDLAVLDLGVQDTPAGSAAQAIAVRLPQVDRAPARRGLTMVWSTRGAPHLHRDRDLRALAAALVPHTDDDAAARLAGFGAGLRKRGGSGREAIATTARAVAQVLKGQDAVAKGDLSAGVTRRIPDGYSEWCRGCRATHVSDQLLRLAALPGGARLLPDTSPQAFAAIPRWPKAIEAEREATLDLVRAYLRLLGPATHKEAAGFLGTTAKEGRALWPDRGLAEVDLGGRPAWLPEEDLAALRRARPVDGVRLLPHADPFLQARDRDLLVPTKAKQKTVWTVLGGPGAVLAEGAVVAAWRAKAKGKRGLEITVQAFTRLSKATRAGLEDEAQRLATVRGLDDVAVHLT